MFAIPKTTLFCLGQQYTDVFLISMILNILCTLISIGALSHSGYSFTQNQFHQTNTKLKFKYLLIISGITSVIMSTSSTISYIACYANLIALSYALRSVFGIALFFTIGILIFSFIVRIQDTFRESVYKIGKHFYSTVLSTLLFSILFSIIGSLTFNLFMYSNPQIAFVGAVLMAVSIGICLIIWIIVSILFVRKLSSLSIECVRMGLPNKQFQIPSFNRSKSKSVSDSHSSNTESKIKSKKKKEKILSVAVRYVVINSFCWILFLCWIVFAFVMDNSNPKDFQMLVNALLSFGTVTFIAVYLQYPFTSEMYAKLCKCLDWCCYFVLHQYIQIRADKHVSNEKVMVDIIVSSSNLELSTHKEITVDVAHAVSV
eukprot:33336_1